MQNGGENIFLKRKQPGDPIVSYRKAMPSAGVHSGETGSQIN